MESVKLTLKDFARICNKQADELCSVSVGDLVKINYFDNHKKRQRIGIVTHVYPDKMQILVENNMKEWWSRFVNCDIIAYNNIIGNDNGSKIQAR